MLKTKEENVYQLYINAANKMEWKCDEKNHPSWFSPFRSIINNKTWCAKCGEINSSIKQRKKTGLKEAQEYAKIRNGKCLSKKYINNKCELEWKCENKEHKTWFAPFDRVVGSHRWCSECANNKKLDGITIAKKHAKTKKGKCLSKEYKNSKSKLEWKCCNSNHSSWFSTFEKIVRRDQLCPECYKERKNHL